MKKTLLTVAKLKLKIFREVDSLEDNRVEELYGLFLNFMNGQEDMEDWEKRTKVQHQGFDDAIKEIE